MNFAFIRRLKNLHLISTVNSDGNSKCNICVEAKFAKKPFKPIIIRSTKLLESIHTDLANFKNTISRGGTKYYIIFVDDFSRYMKVYLLNSKEQAVEMFLKYKAESRKSIG